MQTIDEQLDKARKAQSIICNYNQEKIDELCLAIGWEVFFFVDP